MKYLLALRLLAFCIGGVAACAAAANGPASRGSGGVEGPLYPATAPRSPAPPATTGNELREQALERLHHAFAAADTAGSGTLTPQQARQGGLGYVADHFDGIDTGKTGKVRFEDLKRYLQSRR